MKRASASLTALGLPICLVACVGNAGNYPTLAKRDAERVSGTAEPAGSEPAPPAAPPASSELRERIAQLVASAHKAHEDFLARQESTRHAVSASSGAAPASENWTQAQVAMSGLEALRGEALISLAELDQLYAVESVAFPDAPTPSALALAAARDEIDGMVEQENEVIAALRRQSGG